jgi:hypothetical protein
MFDNMGMISGVVIIIILLIIAAVIGCVIGLLIVKGVCFLWKIVVKMLELREGFGEVVYMYDPRKEQVATGCRHYPMMFPVESGVNQFRFFVSIRSEKKDEVMYEVTSEQFDLLYLGKKISFYWFQGISVSKIHSIKEPKTSCADELAQALLPQQAV